ncbi:hypothetical protein PILCRDRAFT_820273 [Piloderma croceum F 1598]|uniref:Uncharacterized protein n=1 Tax=Piloderma croceum (strain F 1598) TaxID=765440 RepID=A0A0C3BYG7_PILCF|nr:hypothetical protein PILCRDRAFT_820273 [Piloderma croceum F 1598]
MHRSGITADDLEAALGWDQHPSTPTFTLPSTVTTIIAQPDPFRSRPPVNYPALNYADERAILKQLAEHRRERGVIILPTQEASPYLHGWKEIETDWLDKIHGGQGCWPGNGGDSI